MFSGTGTYIYINIYVSTNDVFKYIRTDLKLDLFHIYIGMWVGIVNVSN